MFKYQNLTKTQNSPLLAHIMHIAHFLNLYGTDMGRKNTKKSDNHNHDVIWHFRLIVGFRTNFWPKNDNSRL